MTAEEFLDAWDKGEETFTILSSGSTGAPKPIELKREWMIWSAQASGKIIHHNSGDKLLCCLPLDKVGGLMVLVRARVWGLPVEFREPKSNPLKQASDATIVSLTPYQLKHIAATQKSANHLLNFNEVLIGGSALNPNLENEIKRLKCKTVFRLSYGMSETYSHVAIKTLNGSEKTIGFKAIEGVRIETNQDSCAVIYAPYCPEGMATNDVIEFNSDGTFNIIGRRDFIINTGGVKIQAEHIEALIDQHLKPVSPFLISSLEDDTLGEKIVLVCEDKREFENQDWQFIREQEKYGSPRSIIELKEIPFNDGGKPDRLKVKSLIRMYQA